MAEISNDLVFLAESGDCQAQYELGLAYLNPQVGEIDALKAYHWLSESAKQGLPDAQYRLGDFCETIKQDLPNAIKCYSAAAEQGHAEAQAILGYCYERGHGVAENAVEAAKWHRKAAEQGNAIAQSNLARCYEQGRGIDKNMSEAIKWYEAAAEGGYHIKGVFNDLGLFYMTGNGVEVDELKAVSWLKKAVENEESPAYANLGRCYLCGIGVEQDTTVALELFAKAIRCGIEDAETFLYEHINIAELLMLANTKSPQAQYFAAKWYLQHDSQKAVEMLEELSEQGEPLAMLFLGCILTEGRLVERDLFRADELFTKASELGLQKAHDFSLETQDMIAFHVPYYLVKVTAKEFAEKLLDGEVFMRTISWFVPIERWSRDKSQPYTHKPSVDDQMEGFAKSLGGKPNPFGHWTDEAGNPINDGFRNSGLVDKLLLREKIYCLFAFEYDELRGQFVTPNPQMRDFGDTAVIITDTEEFLKRVSNEVTRRFGGIDHYLAYRRVAYDVDIASGDAYNEFHKTPAYSSQKEFRIALDLSGGLFDKATVDGLSDWLAMNHLRALGKIGDEQSPPTVPLTSEEMKKYKARDFRGMIEVNDNPDYVSDTLTLNIGDIRDIAVALPIEQFLKLKDADFFINQGRKPPLPVKPFVPPRKLYPTFFKEIAYPTEEERNRMLWEDKCRREGLIT